MDFPGELAAREGEVVGDAISTAGCATSTTGRRHAATAAYGVNQERMGVIFGVRLVEKIV